MAKFSIIAEPRTATKRKTNILRAEGKLPAIVYGFDVEPTNITLDRNEMEKLYKNAGESTVLNLEIEGANHEVLIQDIQRDALTGFLTHADFRKIDMTKKVEAVIDLSLKGESAAVKELGGTLIQNLDEVEVLSLPNALVREIFVDITTLKTFEDVIRVENLEIPEGIEILTDGHRSVASVQPPRTEEEMAALDEAVEDNVEDVEVSSEKTEEEGGDVKEEKEEKKEEAKEGK